MTRTVLALLAASASGVIVTAQDALIPGPGDSLGGRVTDRSGRPLSGIVLVLQDEGLSAPASDTPSRRWVRSGEGGRFDAPLPAAFSLIALLPACYDVLEFTQTAAGVELKLSPAAQPAEETGTDRLGGFLTAFATAASPSITSVGQAWSQASQAFGLLRTWGDAWAYSTGIRPTSAGVSPSGFGLNGPLSSSFSSWTSVGSTGNWRPPKGIQVTAVPDCGRWNTMKGDGQ